MIWWVAGVAAVGAVKLVLDSFSEQERRARKNWQNKYNEVKRSTAEHRKHIEKHLEQARHSYDFHVLTDMHFSSMIVANAAYKALDNAKISQVAIAKGIRKTMTEIGQLQDKIDLESSFKERGVLIEEIKLIRELLKEFSTEMDTLKNQTRKLYDEVRELNAQTGALKLAIRDRCGSRGGEWYEARQNNNRMSA